MTNPNTIDNTHPTEDYMGNFGWFPWEDGFHYCDITHDLGDGLEEMHSVGTPSSETRTMAIITEDGIFCDKHCAENARKNALYENALDDRESWYWDGIEFGEKRK